MGTAHYFVAAKSVSLGRDLATESYGLKKQSI